MIRGLQKHITHNLKTVLQHQLTWILDVASDSLSVHHHGRNCLAQFVRSGLHHLSEFRIFRVLHLSLRYQEDTVGSAGDAGGAGDQHLRLVVGHCHTTLVQVLLDRFLRSIQQRFGIDGLVHQT